MKSSHPATGMSLVSVLVSGTIVGIIAMGLVSLLTTSQKSQKNISDKVELDIIRELLFNYVDCDKTFALGGITTSGVATVVNPSAPGSNCGSVSTSASSSDGPIFFRLKRRSLDATVSPWMTDALDSNQSAKIGRYRIRVSCSQSEQSLVIRAIPDDGKTTWDKSRLVFGSLANTGAFPLCFRSISSLSPYMNPTCSLDVNKDTFVSPADVLAIYNEINLNGEHPLSPPSGIPAFYYDVNGNGRVDQSDAQQVMSCISSRTPPCDGSVCVGPPNLSWHKANCRYDVNNDGTIAPGDALVVVNAINASGEHDLSRDPHHPPSHPTGNYIDVNGNGRLDKVDAQQVMEHLHFLSSSGLPATCP